MMTWIRNKNFIYIFKINEIYSKPKNVRSIANAYNPQAVEGKNKQYVPKSTTNSRENKFIMIIPPPNVTGFLHLGHALMATVQDVICRNKQQQGFETIWIPGTDHAGIATQVVVEKKLYKEKKLTRHQLGREQFIKEIWAWKDEKENKIKTDLQKLGCTLNWEKEYFTMDSKQNKAVTNAFIKLFEEGLIERKNSLVNWSCSLQSAVSDIEVDFKEINGPTAIAVPNHDKNILFGKLYDIAYKIVGTDNEIIVSTTRPETLLGDIAVAVHPDDPRYQKFHEKPVTLWHPFREEPIPLIFDRSVQIDFGSGAVKITPAHDKLDFEVAIRHNLKTDIQVFTEKGTIQKQFNNFSGLQRFVARDKILDDLSNLGLLRDIKDHKMLLPMCSRSKDVVEYMLRLQWFLKCQEMAENAIMAVERGEIKIYPEHFKSEWYRWLSSCHDWCISRQLYWGHQIPAYLVEFDETKLWVAATSIEDAGKKAKFLINNENIDMKIIRDTDVLDTWFSSALLPFSVFDWPDDTYKLSYPLDLMETGHDILFFWVARMVMLGQKLTGEIPFKKILLNGIVCDAHGRKMSKSLGNIVTPDQVINGVSFDNMKTEIQKSHENGIISVDELKKSISNLRKLFPNGIPECGTDALRFTLLSHNIKSHFINFDISECHTNRLFFNKIWQATRYTLQSCEKLNFEPKNFDVMSLKNLQLELMDKWILSRLDNTRKLCNEAFANYNFHLATQAIKVFFYTNLCDTYLETTKPGIKDGLEKGLNHCKVLKACISFGLQTMSSITPFIAEELLSYLLSSKEDFEINKMDFIFINNQLESDVSEILNICSSIRQLKSQNNISKKHEPTVHLYANDNSAFQLLNQFKNEINVLTQNSNIDIFNAIGKAENYNFFSTAGHLCSFGIETNDVEIKPTAIQTLNIKKMKKLEDDLSKLIKTISSDGYRKSASEKVQKKHLQKIQQLEAEIKNIKQLN